MKIDSHIGGKFVAIVNIDVPFDDYPNTDEGDKLCRRFIQRETAQKLNMVLKEVREKHGIILAYMPQHINGGPVEP